MRKDENPSNLVSLMVFPLEEVVLLLLISPHKSVCSF